MNRDKPEKINQDCNVCGSAIEVGSAWSRCSNRNCVTREDPPYDGLPSLSTGSSDEEIAEYWEARAMAAESDGPSQDRVDEEVEQAYTEFKNASSETEATARNGAITNLLPLSSYEGYGDLRMGVDK